jgi:hypothetical protein
MADDANDKRKLPITISHHAQLQMRERGASEDEVIAAIRTGEPEPARRNRMMYRKNFQFDNLWRGRSYRIKQVAPVVANEPDRVVVITVFVFYF